MALNAEEVPSNQKSKDMHVLNIHCWRPYIGTRPTGTIQFAGSEIKT